MNKALKKMVEQNIKMDMTPMIDVTFQLLIFFMCTMNFKSMEGFLASHLPKDVGIFNAYTPKNMEEPLKIKLEKNPDGMVVLYCGSRKIEEPGKIDQLYSTLRSITANSNKLSITLIPQPNVEWEEVVDVLNTCHRLNQEYSNRLEIKFHISRN